MIKNGFETRPLGDLIIDIRYGFTGSAIEGSNGIGFLRITDIDDNGKVIYGKLPTVKISQLEAERYFLEPGDCVFARSGSVGKVHIYEGPKRKSVFASYLIRAKFDQSKLDPAYFGVFSRSEFYWKQIDKLRRGGVQQNLNTDAIGRINVSLPPLSIQKQIAAILEKADASREKRRQANQLTEQFLQSAFLEMFGDPVTNPRGFTMKTLFEMCDLITDGKHGDCENQAQSGFYFISAKDIKGGRIDYSESRQVTEKDFREVDKRTNLRFGDILVTNSGTLGRVAIADDPDKVRRTTFQKSVAVLKNRKEILTSSFLKVLLELSRAHLIRGSSGSSQKNLLISEIKAFKIIAPSASEQLRFAALVEKVELLRAKQRESEKKLDNLFNSLMQRAFKGELVQ